MRLIDVLKYAEALEKIEQRLRQQAGEDIVLQKAINFISNAREYALQQPTIDPASLRPKGEWIPSESDFDDDDTLFDVEEWCDWQCTVCHEDICYEDPMERRWLPKFRPNCGADMRKDIK